jgi:hypothetical protein
MVPLKIVRRLTLLTLVLACEQAPPPAETAANADTGMTVTSAIDSFASIPDSVWIDVQGPTMIGFYPQPGSSDELIGGESGVAHLLDLYTFNIGIASESLAVLGFRVTDRPGDTLWLRGPTRRWRFVRDADSSMAGFYAASPDGRHAVRYGTDFSVIEHATAFLAAVRATVPDSSDPDQARSPRRP